MSRALAELVAPAHTVLVTQECQRGVIGDLALLPQLADEARGSVIVNGARLVSAARTAGVPVAHCLAGRRPDGRGSNRNARLFGAMNKMPFAYGTPVTEVVPEFEVQESDLVLTRLHGLGPMAGTDLDPVLRNLGVRTIVGVGVSVNVGMTNFVMDAVNLGYQFVLPRDAVAGVPVEYADAVIDHTLSLLATVVRTDDVLAAWV